MRQSFNLVAGLLAAMLGLLSGCTTKSERVRAEVSLSEVAEIQRTARQFRNIALFAGVGTCSQNTGETLPPQVDKRCYVDVYVTPYTDGFGVEYCLAKLPEKIVFPLSDRNKKKLVVFRLNTVSGNGIYAFDDDVGIKLFTFAGNDVAKGGRGNGDNGSSDPKQFHVRNLHTKAGEALYLPLILQVDASGNPQTVCAAADPKIVND